MKENAFGNKNVEAQQSIRQTLEKQSKEADVKGKSIS